MPPITDKSARIALDTEIFQMDEKRMHRPHGIFASLACTMDGETVYIITDTDQISAFFERLELGVHIWANAKFDITQLRRWTPYPERKQIWDVMLIEQEMFSGYYNDFSLKDLARRWLDVYLEKATRDEFVEAEVMTSEMVEYAAVDVVVTWQVYQAQKAYITDDLDIWRDIDRGALWSVLWSEGMVMDKTAWTCLMELQQQEADKIQGKYSDINLRSPKQVLAYIQSLDRKYKKLASTGEKVLEKITADCEFARDVLAYRKFAKAASTYGTSFLSSIEENGRIYSDFKINGAATGRLSSANPNLENIPRDPRYRACFVAAPGHILVDADWSSQEPRVAAFMSQDKEMIRIFQEHKDIYIEAGRLMFGWELTKADPRRNSRMKPTVLGACYGLTEHGMEEQYGIPQDEGIELLDAFFKVFHSLHDWIQGQQLGHAYVTTIMGRKYWLNPYTDKSNRNSINSPVQGSAGDALKIAAYRFMHWAMEYDPLDVHDIRIVNFIHDELLVECLEDVKDDVSAALKEIMISTAEEMHPGIPADVEIGFGKSWADAH
jgi:DNA polymerase I-like protein with 3'-5' exonuclease and polymerase domains